MTEPNTNEVRQEEVVTLTSATPIAPGDVGQVLHKGVGASRLLDVDAQAGFAIQGIMVDAVNLSPPEGDSTWKDVLDGIELASGKWLIILAKNEGESSATAEISLLVDGDPTHVHLAPTPIGTPDSPRTVTSGTRRVGTPKVQRFNTPAARPQAPVARVVTYPVQPSGDSRVVSRQGAPDEMGAVHTLPGHATGRTGDIVMVIPRDGERVVLMSGGWAHALTRLINHRVPLLPQWKHAILRQLDAALVVKGGVGVQEGSGEVLVTLTDGEIRALVEITRGNLMAVTPEASAAIVRALEKALGIATTKTAQQLTA